MYRKAIEELKLWKSRSNRKPLIVYGARQVGKTWLIEEFGKAEFSSFAIVNMDNKNLHSAFMKKTDPQNIISLLEIKIGRDIDENTLLFIDEIQECPDALESLKYFAEKMPKMPVIAAGSLLGISSGQSISFPVGKTDRMTLHPMDFEEFLIANGKARMVEIIDSYDIESMSALRMEFTDLLKTYMCVGGMPEVVSEYLSGGIRSARAVQMRLVEDYRSDMGKHPPKNDMGRMMSVWDSIPYQLSKENGRKFVYSALKEKGGAAVYLPGIEWLCRYGVIGMVKRISKPGIPLSAYADGKAFKLFVLDVGLLGAASGLDPKSLTDGDVMFTEFKGSLTEQYVYQELIAAGFNPYYWSAEKSDGEIDFILELDGKIIPIEVKAAENLKSKSLKAFRDRYGMELSIRTSLSGTRDEGWMINIPLYAIGNIGSIVNNR